MKVSVVAAADGCVAAVLCTGEVGSIVQAMQDDDVVFIEESLCIFNLGQNLLYCSFGRSPAWRTHSDDVISSLFKFVAGSPGMAAADDQNFRLRALITRFLPRKIRFGVKTKVKNVVQVGQEASTVSIFSSSAEEAGGTSLYRVAPPVLTHEREGYDLRSSGSRILTRRFP